MARKRKRTKTPRTLIDLVIPVYGRFDILKDCLDTIEPALDGLTCNIMLVDNLSPEQEEADKFYKSLDLPNLNIVRNRQNLGFPRACNIGADRKRSPLIFFLNSDVILDPGSIRALVNEMDNPEVGIVGMKLVFPTDHKDLNPNIRPAGKIQHIGVGIDIHTKPVHVMLGWSEDHPRIDKMGKVTAVTGAALMTRRNIWQKIGGFDEGYGLGCLVGDTLIHTSKGLVELSALCRGYPGGTVLWEPDYLKVPGESGEDDVKVSFNNGKQKTIKIGLEKTFELQGTPNHKVININKDGIVNWKRLDELICGDFVAINTNMNLFGDINLDKDLAYLLGLYIAEGYFEHQSKISENVGRITITSGDKEIQDFLINKFGFILSGDKTGIHFRKSGKDFIQQIINCGTNLKKNSLGKSVPTSILQGNRETVRAFLQGLFDGDGCAIKDGRVSYSTSSLKLIKQVQMLLLNFGIVAGYYPRRSKEFPTNLNYLMDFGGESSLFYERIGFSLLRKQERKDKVRPSKTRIVPHQHNRLVRVYKCSKIVGRYKEIWWRLQRKYVGITKRTINKVLSGLSDVRNEDTRYLKCLLNSDIAWLKVKTIKNGGEEYTYDLNVKSDSHSYTANGLIVHNTFEDISFCIETSNLGYNIHVVPEARGTHYTGATAEHYRVNYPMTMNHMRFLQKHLATLKWTAWRFW